jgi:uncharacterized membrane protein YfcA
MTDPKTNQNRENSGLWTLSKFGGLDRLDWLMILVSILIGTIAKQHHFLQLPDGFLEWVFPFLLMMVGYKGRGWITEIIEVRRAKTRKAPDE